jgi:hypothetical protein
MFTNDYHAGEVHRDQRREMLAYAENHRLARQGRAQSRKDEPGPRAGRRLRHILRLAFSPGSA